LQTPQLTILETCEFSAKLRLDESNSAVTPEITSKFVQQALNVLELTNIQDLQVGSDEEGGLSFEQRKRLSIAVELVANPSILFLDEVRKTALTLLHYELFFSLPQQGSFWSSH
jgi:ABC-type multidrug transport system ATPase subunit